MPWVIRIYKSCISIFLPTAINEMQISHQIYFDMQYIMNQVIKWYEGKKLLDKKERKKQGFIYLLKNYYITLLIMMGRVLGILFD